MGIGIVEVVLLGLLLLLLFGSRKLPALGAELGKGLRELKATMAGRRARVEDAPFEEPAVGGAPVGERPGQPAPRG